MGWPTLWFAFSTRLSLQRLPEWVAVANYFEVMAQFPKPRESNRRKRRPRSGCYRDLLGHTFDVEALASHHPRHAPAHPCHHFLDFAEFFHHLLHLREAI